MKAQTAGIPVTTVSGLLALMQGEPVPYPILLVCGVLTLGAEPSAPDLAAYQEARAGVGRDAGAHLKLALWCESRGLKAEGQKHLALAVLVDPANTSARGLMGLVNYLGQWNRPDAVAAKVKADRALAQRLAEYNSLRAGAPETADGQWKLAAWCEKNGLDAEARAHLSAVVRLDPGREAAWKKMGYQKAGGRWVTDAQLATERAEAEAQKAADRKWKPLLARYRTWLAGKDPAKVDGAEAALAELNDPRAVPAVWAVFVAGAKADHGRAVQVLSGIDAAASSRALAYLAAFDDSAEVRRAATETLRRRDPREFAGLLVAMLRDPIKYEVKPVGGPGSPGGLFVNGKRFNTQRVYAPPPVPYVELTPNSRVRFDEQGLPVVDRVLGWTTVNDEIVNRVGVAEGLAINRSSMGALPSSLTPFFKDVSGLPNPSAVDVQVAALDANIRTEVKRVPDRRANVHVASISEHSVTIPIGRMVLEAQQAAAVAGKQLENDVAALDEANREIQEVNDRAAGILSAISGKDIAADATAWRAWWVDQLGYRAEDPQSKYVPTVVENVPIGYAPQAAPYVRTSPVAQKLSYYDAISCFGAGTLVRAIDGPRAIETVKVGDRVLTQSVTTGELAYQPVTATHHNPPSPTFLVRVGGDTIVSSPFHRFWVAGKGWVMARDLKGGETLRLLNGPARVESVEAGPVQPVFNLDVADEHDFFAGSAAALVHDNTLPDTRIVPFDAVPEIAAR